MLRQCSTWAAITFAVLGALAAWHAGGPGCGLIAAVLLGMPFALVER